MRYKKRNLIARRNKILPIHFVRQDMTTYSGLTLIDHYFRLIGIYGRLTKAFETYGFKGDYSIAHILYMLLVMILVGTERFKHLDYIKNDPLFRRVVRLTRIPVLRKNLIQMYLNEDYTKYDTDYQKVFI